MKLGDLVFDADGSTGPWTVLAVEQRPDGEYVRVGFGPHVPGYVGGWTPASEFGVVAESPVPANLGKYKASEVNDWLNRKTGAE